MSGEREWAILNKKFYHIHFKFLKYPIKRGEFKCPICMIELPKSMEMAKRLQESNL